MKWGETYQQKRAYVENALEFWAFVRDSIETKVDKCLRHGQSLHRSEKRENTIFNYANDVVIDSTAFGMCTNAEVLMWVLTNPVVMNHKSKWCFGNVNMETPMYEKMKFSARKFNNSKICFVRNRESSDRLLYV